MACNCHKPSNNNYEGRVRAEDQCITCAKKHLILAANAWGEFCHEDDNRDYVAAHIRAAIDHCKREHTDFARRLRTLAETIEGNHDRDQREIAERLARLVEEVRNLFYTEHPEARRRLDELAETDGKVDLIVPLYKNSHGTDFEELRFLLRSASENCKDLGRVIIAGVATPRWLRNCLVVTIPDDLPTNKDGNMLTKIMKSVELAGVRRFCVAADDNAFVAPIELGRIPPVSGGASRQWFEDTPADKRNNWQKRMLLTYDFFKAWGLEDGTNFDAAHCPQSFTTRRLEMAMRSIPYRDGLGLGAYTCLNMASGNKNGADWNGWVTRVQNAEEAKRPWAVPFLSYTDEAWDGGIRARLATMFPSKCKFEE